MTEFIDFKTLERPKSPNTYLLATAGLCEVATADQPSPHYAASADEVYSTCRKIIEAHKGWELSAADPAARKLHFISTSGLMRFKDDVDILVLANNGPEASSTLAIYSRSRVGYSDLGANAKRVATLLAALGQEGLSS